MKSYLQRILQTHDYSGGEQILVRVDEVNRILVEDAAVFKSNTNDNVDIAHLTVNDGARSFDNFYLRLNKDGMRTLLGNVVGLWNLKRLLLKVEEFSVESLELGSNVLKTSVIVATSVTLLKHPALCRINYRGKRFANFIHRHIGDFEEKLDVMWRMDDPIESFSDFRIIVQEDDISQTVYHVHRNILALGLFARSEYFKHLFRKGGMLTETKKNELLIHLSPLQASGFPNFLDYLYTGKILPATHQVIDQESASLMLLADYFQVPTLKQLVRYRISDAMRKPHMLLQYLLCIVESQHMEEMKELYNRAVFLLVDAIMTDSSCVSDALLIIDTQFLLKVLQTCHRLTRIHNPFTGLWVPQYKETGKFRRYKYITSIIVHQYLVIHGNEVSREEFRALTNDHHMPRVCRNVAQYLLNIELQFSSNDDNSCIPSTNGKYDASDKTSRSLKDRCIDSLRGLKEVFPYTADLANRSICIKIVATDDRFEHGVFMFGPQHLGRSIPSYYEPFCTNTQNKKWTEWGHDYDVKEGIVKKFPCHILHISQSGTKSNLTLRTSEDSVTLISSCDGDYINDFSFIPVRGWDPHWNTYFFLEYCLEDEIDINLPLAT